MKKILAIILFVLIVLSFAFCVYAEEATDIQNPEDTEETEILTLLKDRVLPYLDEGIVIIVSLGSLLHQIRKNKKLNKTIGTMNNNTIAISEQSSEIMNQALTRMENVSNIVTAYDARIVDLLEAYSAIAEDRRRLEKELSEMRAYLKTSAEANIEFANELAELLGLANIPNYKKEEIGSRHLSAVRSIRTAEHEALNAVKEALDG